MIQRFLEDYMTIIKYLLTKANNIQNKQWIIFRRPLFVTICNDGSNIGEHSNNHNCYSESVCMICHARLSLGVFWWILTSRYVLLTRS